MRASRDDGFTLIELLVVIVIIAILSAIAIPTFLKQREKAWRTQAVNDMKNAATALESWAANESGGSYLGLNGATQSSPALKGEGYRSNVLVDVQVVSTAREYCVRGRHRHLTGVEYVYRSGVGVVQSGAPGVIPCT